MIDLHVHSEFSVDSQSELEQIAKVAKSKGLKYVGINDHYEMRFGKLKYGFDTEEFLKAMDSINSDVTLLKGVEWGWDCEGDVPNFEGFDYISLSVHRCDKPINNIEECYRDILERMLQCVEEADFDVLDHFDFVRRYMPNTPPIPGHLKSIVMDILKVISNKGRAVELNTEGFSIFGEPHPPVWILKEIFKMGIPITIGSDAHNLEDVGRDVDKALNLIRDLGFKEVVIFKMRRMEALEI